MRKGNLSLFALLIFFFPVSLLADAKTDFGRALDNYRLCRFEEAKSDFEKFLQLYPQNRDIPRVLYRLAELEPNPGKALTHYERILSDYARSEVADSALFRVGSYRMASGQYAGAEEAFSKLLRRYPDSHLKQMVRYWLGVSYLARKDRVSAIGEFKEVVRISPDSEYGDLAKMDLERMEVRLKPFLGREAVPRVSPEGRYLVQVGSFAEFQAALRLRKKLEGKGYPVSFSETVVREQTFYRVRVGPYFTKEEARRIGERLARGERLQCWIVKKQP